MTLEIREFASEGHRLLVEGDYSPAETARLAGLPRQRVSEWRTGRKRPDADARAALERAVGIPARAWDAAPIRRAPEAPAPVPEPPPAVQAPAVGAAVVPVVDLEGVDLPSLGLPGLQRLAARLRALEPTLPPRERVSALQAEARVLAVHEQLRQRDADAREEYLRSPEFFADARTLVAAIPPATTSSDLRAAVGRLGVNLPAPTEPSATTAADPPTTAEDLEELLGELQVARDFRDRGEVALAAAHVAGLALDTHADAIGALLVDRPELAVRMLDALDQADVRAVRAALERRMAVRDVQAIDAPARVVVAELLRQLGHGDLAGEIGG